MKSVMQSNKRCFICGKRTDLSVHHALHGTANRKLADKYGLTVYLCRECHMNLHDKGLYDKELQQFAQRKWEANYGSREEFRQLFGKSWL